jgi:DNA (cytosine-5)-methyltransferase 1
MLIVDNFCGAGGASTGIAMAMGRHPDIAVNHDLHAIRMHTANHPDTVHFLNDVWAVDPYEATMGSAVELAWFSPDCTHFSKAKGGTPVRKEIRDLAWVAVKWLRAVHPEVIVVENVEEFQTWGPLLPVLDEHGQPLLGADGTPLMQPDPDRKGETFQKWVKGFKQEGYSIDWKVLCAADYGAPTIRKRLFVVARRDGRPIEWPVPTHARGGAGGLKPWVGAHTIIDWSLPCPSIFDRSRPLADNTCKRIAHGVVRYVLEAAEPFIVRSGHTSSGPGSKVKPTTDPLSTIVTKNSHMLVVPSVTKFYGTGTSGAVTDPLGAVTAQGQHFGLVAAFLAKHYGGDRQQMAVGIDQPFPAITARGTQNQIVEVGMSPGAGGNAELIAPFMMKYYSQGGQWQDIQDPLHTIPTKGRFGLVSCRLSGEPWVITDIGMRMLEAHELAAAQGFPEDYVFLGNKTEQIARIGNSVVPLMAAAVVASQFPKKRKAA